MRVAMKLIQGGGNPPALSPKVREARLRGLRIGSWVASELARAAGSAVSSDPFVVAQREVDPAVTERMNKEAEEFRKWYEENKHWIHP